MKCPNCGFECNDKYCAMCGTKIPEQPVNSNFYAAAPNPAPVNQTPIFPVNNPNINGIFNSENPDGQIGMSFNQGNPVETVPQNAPNIPAPGIPLSTQCPTPPQKNTVPRKKIKTMPIVIACLIFAVIAAGVIISVYSACTYNKSIIHDFIDEKSDNSDNYAYDIND